MSDLKPAAEVARELGRYARQGTIHRAHPPADLVMVIAQAITARDLAVAERVLWLAEAVVRDYDIDWTKGTADNVMLAAAAIRALDPATLLEMDRETE